MTERGRRQAVLVAVLVLLQSPASAEILVLKDGRRIETRGPWSLEGRQVIFHTPGGALSMLRSSDLDLEATRAANALPKAEAEPQKPPSTAPESVLKITNEDLRPIWKGVSRYLILKEYDQRQRYRSGVGPPIVAAAELDHALSWLLAVADNYAQLDTWPKQAEQMKKLAKPLLAFSSEIESRLEDELTGHAQELAKDVARQADNLARRAEAHPEIALRNLGNFDELRERFGDLP